MIGFKVNIGYTLENTPPNSLNDVIFTDVDKPFIFYTTNGYTQSDVNYNNFSELYSTLYDVLGIGADAIYLTSVSTFFNDDYENLINNTFPSVLLGYSNYYNYLKSASGAPHLVIYFVGLKRLIWFGDNLFRDMMNLYSVGDTLTYLAQISLSTYQGFFNSMTLARGSNIAYLPFVITIPNYNENMDLSNWEIYGRIRMNIANNQNILAIENGPLYSDSASFILNLFGDNQNPDWDFGPDNPYEPGGPSTEGGGGGNFDNDSDPIPDSSLPTISSANTGFTRIYNPTLSQVQALARYLWTDESVIQTIWNHIKQYFENPMEAIIGFNLVPVPVPDGGTQNFALMYIDTGVSMTVAANQFVDVDCGMLEITPYYGSALDYSPYTKISCFLPFIGTVQLNVDEVMNTTLQVKYRVDICSGSCVAKILVNGNVLYQYSGHCAINIPISAADFSSYVTASISVAKLAIGAAVGGGMGALMAGGDNPVQQTNQVVTTTQVTNTARNPNTGRQITTGTQTTVQTVERPNDQSSTQGSYAGLVPENITNTVGQIMSSKPHVEHSGSFSGNTGYLGVRRPYVIIQRPNMCMPSQYQAFNGFPSMITLSLGECKGFTKVQQVQLTGFYATNPEQAEILQLLKSGVIL